MGIYIVVPSGAVGPNKDGPDTRPKGISFHSPVPALMPIQEGPLPFTAMVMPTAVAPPCGVG